MEFTPDGWLKIISVVVTILIAYFGRQRRPRVEAFLVHVAAHPVPYDQPNQQAVQGQTLPQQQGVPAYFQVNSHTLIVRNLGAEPARNVHISHSVLPVSINVWPTRAYQKNAFQPAGGELVFETLSPKEQVTIAYLYYPPLTYSDINTVVRSDDGLVQILPITTYTRVYPPLVRGLVLCFLAIGVATVVFALLKYVLLPYITA